VTRQDEGPPGSAPGLVRGLNGFDTTLLVMGLIVGSGIFLTPASIAKGLPAAGAILALWIVGGLIALAGSLVFAELGAMMPKVGGSYVFIRDAYGPLPAFLYGWVTYLVVMCGGVAAIATGCAEYVGVFFPALGTKHVLLTLGPVAISAGQLVAVAAVLVHSAAQYRGVTFGTRLQASFTFLALLAMLGLIAGGAASGASVPAAAPPAPPIPWLAYVTALVAVLWSYDGGNFIAAAAGEVARPQRNLPLGLVGGTGLVMLIYVALNAAYLKAIPASEMAGVARPAQLAAERLIGPFAGVLITAAIVAATFGCTGATLTPGPRIAYAMAGDGLFPAPFGRVHPGYHTPSFGIGLQAVWTALLCLSGRYDQLYTYAIFATLLGYVAGAVALFLFRRRLPDLPRPYRCWGYPVVPGLYVAALLLVLGSTLVEQPKESLAGLGILALGLPVYAWMTRKAPTAAPSP